MANSKKNKGVEEKISSPSMSGRMARVSTAGEMQTGLMEKGWENLSNPHSTTVLQIGKPAFGESMIGHISRHLGFEVTEVCTIGTTGDFSIKCGLKPCEQGISRNEEEWYDIDSVIEEIPDTWRLLVINNSEFPRGNSGLLDYEWLLSKSQKVVLTEVDSPSQHSLALRIAQACRGFIRMDMVDLGKGSVETIAIIEPAPSVKTPRPMPYPSIAKILPRRMKVPPPLGIANDYHHISSEVKKRVSSWKPTLRISVVIPLYNRRTMLGRTLAMLTHQTYPLDLIEVVIADDGSSDDPISMIEGSLIV